MLLVITGIGDGTVDVLVDKFSVPFFRFNLDDFESYTFEMSQDSWKITNPTGHSISSENATRCFWWKAFMYQLSHDKYVKEELKVIAENLYSWFSRRGLIVGNPPYLEKYLGKLTQASIAKNYFKVPNQKICWGGLELSVEDPGKNWVVKSLSANLTDSGKALFTTEIKVNELDPKYPWYVQEKIESLSDITILCAGEKFFAFSRSRENLSGLDWRREQFTNPITWVPFSLDVKTRDNLINMLKDMDIEWGRADFLQVENELIFLEINPNGQWVFLDSQNTIGLVSEVADYIMHGSTH